MYFGISLFFWEKLNFITLKKSFRFKQRLQKKLQFRIDFPKFVVSLFVIRPENDFWHDDEVKKQFLFQSLARCRYLPQASNVVYRCFSNTHFFHNQIV